MARAVIAEALVDACPDMAALKKALPFDASNRETERTALTHALWCPTCKPIADDMRRAQAAVTERLAQEAHAETARQAVDVLDQAAKVIETNGYFETYLWDTEQAARGTPIERCRVDIFGAVAIVLYGSPIYAGTARVEAVERFLAARIDAPSVAAWSCYPGNGQQQALELIRDTADSLRALHNTPQSPGGSHDHHAR